MLKLEPTATVLLQAAREDPNSEVRRQAATRINELSVLRHIASWDTEPRVREAAAARFQEVMAGRPADSPPLAARLATLDQPLAQDLVEYLAVHAVESPLRSAALRRIDQESFLIERALEDRSAEVRLVALERLRHEASLEAVVRAAQKRDKQVWRRARERLANLRADQAQATERERICQEAESILQESDVPETAARFQKLEQQWDELTHGSREELEQRFARARTAFQENRRRHAAIRAEKNKLCKDVEDVLGRCRSQEEMNDDLADIVANCLVRSKTAWQEVGLLDLAEERQLVERFEGLLRDLESVAEQRQETRQRADRQREFLAQIDRDLAAGTVVSESQLKRLQREWEALPSPESRHLAAALQARFQHTLQGLRARLKEQHERRDQDTEELKSVVDALDRALREGELQQAISLRDRLRHRLDQEQDLAPKQRKTIEQRLRATEPKLRELRGWRRWGTAQARENLCEEVEMLCESDFDPETLAQRIRETREKWRNLDRAEGPAPEAVWQRFNGACNRAYEPCQAYFEEKAREREQNYHAKQALIERLNEFAQEADWNDVDWRKVDRFVRDIRQQWRETGPVPRSQRKLLEQAYQDALAVFEKNLTEERERDLKRRKQLIHEVQALLESDDLKTAIVGAREAQARWRPTVQASRRVERALWTQLRSACDAIFARRDAEREAIEQERRANLDQKRGLCEEIEGYIQNADEVGRHQPRVKEIHGEWDRMGPVPREEAEAIEKRFRQALADFERARIRQIEQRRLNELTALRQRAELCRQLEERILRGETDPAVAEQAEAQWSQLAAVEAQHQAPVRQRFEADNAALRGDEVARTTLMNALSENLAKCRRLCLRMEIAAGVDSPEEFAQERMEYQVSRLSGALAGDANPTGVEEVQQMERDWYGIGPVPLEDQASLEERFQRARAAVQESA